MCADGSELRRTVSHLQRLRREGIQHFHVARIYERLLKKRENDRGVHKLLSDVIKHLQVCRITSYEIKW